MSFKLTHCFQVLVRTHHVRLLIGQLPFSSSHTLTGLFKLLLPISDLRLPLVCYASKVILVMCHPVLKLVNEVAKLVAFLSDLFQLSFGTIAILLGQAKMNIVGATYEAEPHQITHSLHLINVRCKVLSSTRRALDFRVLLVEHIQLLCQMLDLQQILFAFFIAAIQAGSRNFKLVAQGVIVL